MPHIYAHSATVPKTMRALAKIDPAPGLKLIEALVPIPGPGEVLIRVQKTALSEAATHIDRWDPWAQRHVRPPLVVGHEFVGLVAAVGAGVTDLHPGERVIGEPYVACGTCRHCVGGHRHLCTTARRLGQDRDGAFAEYIGLPQTSVWHADPRLPTDVLATFSPLGEVVRIARRFDLLGAHVLIVGANNMGAMAAAIARHGGARSIVVADANPAALALAKTLGATQTIDTRETDLDSARRVLGITDGFDLGIETSGTPTALADLLHHVRLGGQLALLGLQTAEVPLSLETLQSKQITLHGIAPRDNIADWERLTLALHSGLDITPLISHCLPFGCFREAFDRVASGEPGKIILDWES